MCSGLLLGPHLPARAQAPDPQASPDEPRWEEVCKANLTQPLPPGAAALAAKAHADRDAPRNCDEQTAYYGFGRPPDYREALRCAYLEREKPGNDSFMEGRGILAMLYANGYGVPRDYTLAIRFTCELADRGAADAETEGRLGRLEAMRDGKLPAGKPFNICDDATSGALGSYCADVEQKQAAVSRAQRMRVLRASLPAQARAAFPDLQAAETAFEQARGKHEYTGGGGSGGAGFQQEDQGALREQFVINLRRFASNDLPSADAAERERAERRMEAAEAKAIQAALPAGSPQLGAVDPDRSSLASTQQSWRRLFAAWMRFVPLAYPNLNRDRAATELLQLRTHQLAKLAPAS